MNHLNKKIDKRNQEVEFSLKNWKPGTEWKQKLMMSKSGMT